MKIVNYIKKYLLPTIRYLLTGTLIVYCLTIIDWQLLIKGCIGIKPTWIILSFVMLFLSTLLAGMRWCNFMSIANVPGTRLHKLTLYIYGSLINQGLPSTVGGDLYRASKMSNLSLDNAPIKLTQIFSDTRFQLLKVNLIVVVLDRLCGLYGNLILAALGLILAAYMLPPWALITGYVLLSIILISTFAISILLQIGKIRRWLLAVSVRLLIPSIFPVLAHLFDFPTVLWEFVRSLAVHLLGLAAFFFCLKAFGVEPPVEALLLVLSTVNLLVMLPISLSGWGLRETTAAGLFALWGIEPTLTITASVAFGIILLLTLLPGIYYLSLSKSKVMV